MEDKRYLTFALGKGRLAKKTLELFEKFQGQAFPPFMQKIIDCEGLVNYINQK